MCRPLRHDYHKSIDNDIVENSLKRYYAVIKGELPPRFKISKLTPIEIDSNLKGYEIWKIHEKGLDKYHKLLGKINNGKIELDDIEEPQYSLLDLKIDIANKILESCHFCEHKCRVNRANGETGICGVNKKSRISSEFMHHGEEPELVPSYTIFFNGCTFKCKYCQNWDISQNPEDEFEVSTRALANSISNAWGKGARNINWVGGDPTPNLHNILSALKKSKVSIPSVWNSNMYLSEEGMKLLFGTQDIYLTDLKYGDNTCALNYSEIPNYWNIIRRNHKLAARDSELIIRHLVLPGHIDCCTEPILKWISEDLGVNIRINIMGQYRPCWRVKEYPDKYPELNRNPSVGEMKNTYKIAEKAGLKNIV